MSKAKHHVHELVDQLAKGFGHLADASEPDSDVHKTFGAMQAACESCSKTFAAIGAHPHDKAELDSDLLKAILGDQIVPIDGVRKTIPTDARVTPVTRAGQPELQKLRDSVDPELRHFLEI